jgi:hypothetical protein
VFLDVWDWKKKKEHMENKPFLPFQITVRWQRIFF